VIYLDYKMIHVLETPISEIMYKGKEQVLHDIYYRYNPKNIFSEMHMITTDKNDLEIDLHEKCVIHYLPQLPDPFHFFNIFIDAFKIARIAKKESVDLIFSQGVFFNSIKAILAAKICKKPVMVNVIGEYRRCQEEMGRYYMRSKRFSYWVETFVLKHADMIFCISEHLKRYVVGLGINPRKIRVSTNRWIDTDLFSPSTKGNKVREELNLTDKKIVLCVGRLSKEKLREYVIESIPYILRYVPDVKFVIVGDGPQKDELVARCKELGVRNAAIFCGSQPIERVAKFNAAADVIICPYSGLELLEALSSGKPVVAFNVDWHSDVIKNMKNGVLVEFKNVEEMAKAVVILLKDKKLADTLGRNARKSVLKSHTKEILWEKEVGFFKELLERKNEESSNTP